ncbi:hypothetical protein RFI_03627, partial [Reticulomyxa filosa]
MYLSYLQFKKLIIMLRKCMLQIDFLTILIERTCKFLSYSEEEEIQVIVKHWIRVLHIKFGWIQYFEKIVVDYATTIFILDMFCSSSKLLKTFYGHSECVNSIDYSTFNDGQFICSGSSDTTVRVWDLETGQHIQSFNGHSYEVSCVKFSPYHYHNHFRNVICSSSYDKTIHKTIRLWDVETSKPLYIFNEHKYGVQCVDFSPLQSNLNISSSIGVIGGNGYTICSGSSDETIRIWDIETAKQIVIFKWHTSTANSVKYGSNELGISGGANTILSGSNDKSVRLWDIRSRRQIQVFKGHSNFVKAVEYSPFV